MIGGFKIWWCHFSHVQCWLGRQIFFASQVTAAVFVGISEAVVYGKKSSIICMTKRVYLKWRGEETMFFSFCKIKKKERKKILTVCFWSSTNKIHPTGLWKSQQYCNIHNEGICKKLWIQNVCKCFDSYALHLFSIVAMAHTPCTYSSKELNALYKKQQHADITGKLWISFSTVWQHMKTHNTAK